MQPDEHHPSNHSRPGNASADLRRDAEVRLGQPLSADVADTDPDTRRLVHELGVSHVELELQNEQLRQAQLELEHSNDRYFDLYEQAPFGYITLSASTQIREINRSGAAILGLAGRSLVNRRFTDHVWGGDRALFDKHWSALVETGTPQSFDLRMRTGADEYLIARVYMNLADADETGRSTCRVAFLDITDQVATSTRLSAALETVQGNEQRLKEADQKKDEFLAMLAHELRNPLAPIRNAVAVMRFMQLPDKRLEWCRDVINRQVSQMAALLEDLMDVSRITRNRITLQRSRVELGSAIEQAIEAAKPLTDLRGHTVTVSMPGAPIEVDGDPTRLAQIFGNLLSNAAKYTEPHGHLGVTVTLRERDVCVEVSDTGIGIAASSLPRLFDLFSQVDPSSERSQGGLGIGLALVKALVDLHGGTVSVRSPGLGLGSTFEVYLPTITESDSSVGRAIDNDDALVPAVNIVVVDDNPDVAHSLAIVLRMWGTEVHEAFSGAEALEAARTVRPQVVLLDLGMPGLDGLELARRIRAEPWGSDVMLIACTGRGLAEDRQRSMEAGIDEHFVKPIDLGQLKNLLRRRFGDLTR